MIDSGAEVLLLIASKDQKLNMTHRPLSLQYRPQTFAELIGQSDIVKPLIYSLDAQKPHPAYLLTGIRGIGKTTIARIIAKSLNCEKGISSQPCEQCPSCHSIREGRHPDVFEIDAASRTRVEDTREVLDNIQYQPAEARFKIFIIDEVHMLSNHSFNALLKTLEEPPEHVRFILATTDPQKIPATVVSRCLQYHLLRICPELIVKHMAHILQQENIQFEEVALNEIALASESSMRDALSLLEQAIYFSEGNIKAETVLNMLGLTDRQTISALLQSLAAKDLQQCLSLVDQLFKQGAQLAKVIEQLIDAIHELSIYKVAPDLVNSVYADQANHFSHEALQIMYQACLLAKRDVDLSPSEKAALEMLLLRLIHFTPIKTVQEKPVTLEKTSQQAAAQKAPVPQSKPVTQTTAKAEPTHTAPPAPESPVAPTGNPWLDIVNSLKLTGIALEIVNHATLKNKTPEQITLLLNPKYQSMVNDQMLERIEQSIQSVTQEKNKLNIEFQKASEQTPYEIKQAQAKATHQAQLNQLEQDPGIQMLKEQLGAQIAPETVQPITELTNQEE